MTFGFNNDKSRLPYTGNCWTMDKSAFPVLDRVCTDVPTPLVGCRMHCISSYSVADCQRASKHVTATDCARQVRQAVDNVRVQTGKSLDGSACAAFRAVPDRHGRAGIAGTSRHRDRQGDARHPGRARQPTPASPSSAACGQGNPPCRPSRSRTRPARSRTLAMACAIAGVDAVGRVLPLRAAVPPPDRPPQTAAPKVSPNGRTTTRAGSPSSTSCRVAAPSRRKRIA